jgi:phytoene desaturase
VLKNPQRLGFYYSLVNEFDRWKVTMSEKRKVVIIGAGPGGLSAAMLLAHKGVDVLVLEKEKVPGGRNAAIKLGKYTFDTGPTFLMMDFVLRELFTIAGRNLDEHLKLTRLDPMYRLGFKKFDLKMCDNAEEMKKRLEAIWPGSSPGFERFLKNESSRFENLYPCMQKSYGKITDYLSFQLMKATPHLSAGKSMFQELGKYFDSDDQKIAFTFQSKYLGMSAWECPALFTMIPYVEHRFGIYHVEGGLNQISHAMHKEAVKDGAEFRFNTTVKKVINQGRKVTGVQLDDGTVIEADDVFINADFGWAASNLLADAGLKKYTPVKVAGLKYSCSTFMMYLGVDKIYDLEHHNVFFAEDYKSNVEDIFTKGRISEEPSFYVQNASITDPTLAPEGHSTIYILAPMPNLQIGSASWSKEVKTMRQKIIHNLKTRCGMEDIEDHIQKEKIITPAGWRDDYNVQFGATFNLAHNYMQLLGFRPNNKFEELDNCYLVGGGTHPGSGLPTIYESARISADLYFQNNKG